MSQENSFTKNQKLKKYIVFGIMFLAFAGCMWLIFAPSGDEKMKEKQGIGFNNEVPSPDNQTIYSDKRAAYEQEQMRKRRDGDMLSLQDYSSMLENSRDNVREIEINDGFDDANLAVTENKSAIKSSVSSYQDINRTLGTFYIEPEYDPEKEELEKRLRELEARLDEKESKESAIDEQLALMEKSYQLAAKYMPQYGGEDQYYGENKGLSAEEMKNKIVKSSSKNNNKTQVSPVRQISNRTISSLKQELGLSELVSFYDQPLNTGFNTLKKEVAENNKNTISACIHGDQVVMNGQSVFVRLLEPIQVEKDVIPRNAILTGLANLQGERLEILISSIEHNGAIYPVKITIYDTDGTKGVYIPASMELDAAKEMVANMGTSMGTSVSVTKNAGSQVAADLSRGVIQGTSQLFAKKIRMVKINLKAGHKVLLLPDNQ